MAYGIPVIDTSRPDDRMASTIVAGILAGLHLIVMYWFLREYRQHIKHYKSHLNKLMDFVTDQHRFYVNEFDSNKDKIFTYIETTMPEFGIDIDEIQNGLDYNGHYLNCSSNLEKRINGGQRMASRRLQSTNLSYRVQMAQRRLRDAESFENAYDMMRMNAQAKYYAYGSTEQTKIMEYYNNAIVKESSLLTMASRGFSASLTGFMYHLDSAFNRPAETSYTNSNASENQSYNTGSSSNVNSGWNNA